MTTDSKKKPLSPEHKQECEALNRIYLAKKRELKLTQSKIAEAANISTAAISFYLSGVNPLNLSIASVFSILLKVPISEFSPRLASEADLINSTHRSNLYTEKDKFSAMLGAAESTIPYFHQTYFQVAGKLSENNKQIFAGSPKAPASINGANQYILTIGDQAFAPRLRRGDRALIDPDRKPEQFDDLLISYPKMLGKLAVYCLISEDEESYTVLDPSTPAGQKVIFKRHIGAVEVIAAIFPASSMKKVTLKHLDENKSNDLKKLRDELDF